MSDMAKNAKQRGSVIIDSPKVIVTLLAIVFLSYIAWRRISSPTPIDDYTGLIILVIIDALFIVRFLVISKGFVIDVEKDELTFPGGGIEADSWTSYFNPMYWLQGLQRHKINLSEVREIQSYMDIDGGRNKNKLEINGDFGAVSFRFWSKGKRDQLYSAIVNINEMGDPIVYR